MNHPRFLNNPAQKQNTEQQNFSLAFLHQMINSISDPIFVKDRQHRWVLLNDTYCNYVGHSREELIGKSDYDFFPEAEADVFWQKDELIFTTNIINANQDLFTDAQGITHLISTKKSCFEDETGNKFLVVSIRDIILQNETVAGRVTDFTQLMQTLEELRQHKKELAIALETAELKRHRYQNMFDLTWRWLLCNISEQQAAMCDVYDELCLRQQAEENLHRINAVLQGQQEASIDGILIIDENRIVTSSNQKFSQLWQIPAALLQTHDDRKLLGWVLDQLINPDEFLAKVEYLSQHPEESSRDEIFLKSGKIFDRYSAPVHKHQGACSETSLLKDYYGRIWYFRDITEYKQAEAELRASQQRLVLLIEQTPLAIIEWNTDFEVQTWNRAAERIFGYTTEEMLENSFAVIVPENARKHVKEIIATLLTQRGGSFSVNENVTKDGRTIVCEWYNNPLVAPDGLVIGVASMVLDITERKQAKEALQKSEAQLRQQAQELKEALRELQHTQTHLIQSEKMSSLGQLVAGVAHEINNPVNFIYGNLNPAKEYTQDLLSLLQLYQSHYPEPMVEIQDFAELIELDFLKSDLPQIINSMKVGADRIREIVLSLRTFSRLDEAEMKAVDIHQGIDSTLMILQSRLKDNDQRPTIEIIKEYGKLPLVECYAGQLNQVFMNILSNAIDALEESLVICPIFGENAQGVEQMTSPQIRICTQLQEPNQVIIRIADNGLGIPEDITKQLFNPFFTTKPIGKGTGMGLAISYQIITERHGGSLECFSQPRQGAEFVIKIPLIQDTSAYLVS